MSYTYATDINGDLHFANPSNCQQLIEFVNRGNETQLQVTEKLILIAQSSKGYIGLYRNGSIPLHNHLTMTGANYPHFVASDLELDVRSAT